MGSTASYDARFINSLSDGDSVSSWLDLTSSNNVASNVGSNRPIFKTSQFGGQPAIQFNSSSSQKLNLTTSVAINSTSESLLVTKKTGNFLIGLSNNSGLVRGYNFFDYSDNIVYITSSSLGEGCYFSNNGSLNSIWLLGPNSVFRLNGISKSSTSLGGFSRENATVIGARDNEFSDGLISLISYFPSPLTPSIRLRLEKSSAFAFKIACS